MKKRLFALLHTIILSIYSCSASDQKLTSISCYSKNIADENYAILHPIHEASIDNNKEKVISLLQSNPSLITEASFPTGMKPLHFAAKHGHIDIIKYLVKQGAKINDYSREGCTSLDYARKNLQFDASDLIKEIGGIAHRYKYGSDYRKTKRRSTRHEPPSINDIQLSNEFIPREKFKSSTSSLKDSGIKRKRDEIDYYKDNDQEPKRAKSCKSDEYKSDKPLDVTNHAKNRMQERNISIDDIKKTLQNGFISKRDLRDSNQKITYKTQEIKVVTTKENRIITAMRPNLT